MCYLEFFYWFMWLSWACVFSWLFLMFGFLLIWRSKFFRVGVCRRVFVFKMSFFFGIFG